MPKETKSKNKRETENSAESFYLGKMGENALRSASLSLFNGEVYIHLNDFSKKKSLSMTVEEYNYLCSLHSTVTSWSDYQKQQIAYNNSFYNTAFNNQQPYQLLAPPPPPPQATAPATQPFAPPLPQGNPAPVSRGISNIPPPPPAPTTSVTGWNPNQPFHFNPY